MSAKKGGLGRGLDALFTDNSIDSASAATAVELRINEIEPNREQPRRVFDEDAIAALAESIGKHGVIQPILVRPLPDGGYQLVAGERRWRAARMAGLSEIPVVIRELSDADTMVIALIENLQREDLNPVEEAQGYRTLMQRLEMTQEEAAEAVGKSRPAVANSLRLLKLPEDLLAMVESAALSAGHARTLLAYDDADTQRLAAQEIVGKQLSVRQAEALVRALQKKVQPAPERSSARRESYFDEVALALTENLGRKVRVATHTNGKSGVLSIDFSTKEDLSALAAALKVLEN